MVILCCVKMKVIGLNWYPIYKIVIKSVFVRVATKNVVNTLFLMFV